MKMLVQYNTATMCAGTTHKSTPRRRPLAHPFHFETIRTTVNLQKLLIFTLTVLYSGGSYGIGVQAAEQVMTLTNQLVYHICF
jgi:hypothetical protein